MGTRAADDLWAKVAAAVRAQLSEATWNTWFPGVHALDLTDDTIVLGVPSSVAVERIRTSYLGLLKDAAQALTGVPLVVDLIVDTAPRRDDLVMPDPLPTAAAAPFVGPDVGPPRCDEGFGQGNAITLNPRYTFEDFVIGAFEPVRARRRPVGRRQPGALVQPASFIYGPAGLGKTHLLHAIGHHCASCSPPNAFATSRPRH